MGSLSPYTEPRAKGQREGTIQAREQARLWFKVSFLQTVEKRSSQKRGGLRNAPSTPPRSGRAKCLSTWKSISAAQANPEWVWAVKCW